MVWAHSCMKFDLQRPLTLNRDLEKPKIPVALGTARLYIFRYNLNWNLLHFFSPYDNRWTLGAKSVRSIPDNSSSIFEKLRDSDSYTKTVNSWIVFAYSSGYAVGHIPTLIIEKRPVNCLSNKSNMDTVETYANKCILWRIFEYGDEKYFSKISFRHYWLN